MKTSRRFFLAASALVSLSLAVPATLPGKEEKPEAKVTASIRPKGKVKRVDLPALAKIPFAQALQAAQAAVPGGVIKAELEVEDGNLMYSFEIVGADKVVTEVEIDAGDGKVLDIDKN